MWDLIITIILLSISPSDCNRMHIYPKYLGPIRQLVSNDNFQFGCVPGRGKTDTIFVIRQLQEKYLAANKRLYMAFVDLEKAFDWVPRKVLWWALRKLVVEEWIMRLVQETYANVRSHVLVGEGYSEGWWSPRLGTKPTALHHCVWSLVMWVPLWGPLGRPLCRWPCYHRWIAQGIVSKCRKDKDHDRWYGPGPPAEFSWVSMHHLSHWSGQQQHLPQQLQVLGAQEMQ